MRPRLVAILLLNVSLSSCVTVNKYSTTIASKTKIELPAIIIECKLNDIAIVKAPKISEKNGRYYLYAPNGHIIKLDMSYHRHSKLGGNVASNDSIINNDNVISNDEIESSKYRLFNVNEHFNVSSTNDVFREYVNSMDAMEFMMGPLGEDDHGNWVLSVFYTDINGDIVELFQVISIEIVELIPAHPSQLRLSRGSDFKLRFAYPIKYLESCELQPPSSMGDRFYDRDGGTANSCGYVVPNVTYEDTGVWTIVGVGKIVYEAKMFLKVYNRYL